MKNMHHSIDCEGHGSIVKNVATLLSVKAPRRARRRRRLQQKVVAAACERRRRNYYLIF